MADKIIAITGGIGSGKSVVSHVLRIMGFAVYDCDSRAKCLMQEDSDLKKRLSVAFSDGVVCDRRKLASIVFSSPDLLSLLNSIVHPAVRADLIYWAQGKEGLVFVETAILKESGMIDMIDEIWIVDAPKGLRIERVMARNNMSREDVEKRINSQSRDIYFDNKSVKMIINDGYHSLLAQINSNLN